MGVPSAGSGGSGETFGGNLTRRVLTAVVVLPALLLAIFLFPPRGAYLIAATFCVLAFGEAHTLLGRIGRAGHWSFFPGLGVFFTLAGLPDGRVVPIQGLTFMFTVVAAWAIVRRVEREGKDVLPVETAGVVAGLLIGTGTGCAAGLATMAPLERSAARVLLLVAIIVTSDVAAFFVGHAFGKTKLSPVVSPGKTVEGAIGGLLGGALASGVMGVFFFSDGPWWLMAAIGAIVAAAGIVGDLVESLFKRYVGVKDSGMLFPGHGGVLDRIDAFLLAAPILYGFFAAG